MMKLYKFRGLLLILLTAALLAGCSGDGKPASADIFDTLTGDTYHLKGTFGGITMEAYCKDGMTAMIIEDSSGDVTRMINRDGKNHGINDAERLMYIYEADEPPSVALPSADLAYVVSGESDFNGKTLPYDEYSDGGEVKVWLFIDGNSLAGLRILEDGESNDITILILDKNVPDGVFDLPEGYDETEI
ncbi:MAG: hypothetical protein FWH10_01375 [Oscillospiraceae bacterium]|nr:hypothetical protein [Oscillospiraceae bacterium]